MIRELRCSSKKHGEIDTEEKFFEVKCSSKFCGAAPGVIVIHRFNFIGELVETSKYKEIGA